MKKIIKTNDLYEGAFYLYWGAKLNETYGTYPRIVYVLEMNVLKKWLAEKVGLVNWKRFRKKRMSLKKMVDGSFSKFKLGDIATVKEFKQK